MMLPPEVGVMTLRNATLFPQSLLPLYIFEPRYRRMLRDALESHRMFCVAMRRADQSREVPEPVAGLGLIRAAVDHADGTSHLVVEGVTRIRLRQAVRYRPYRLQRFEPLPTPPAETPHLDALAARLRELVTERLELGILLPAPLGGDGTPEERRQRMQDILRYLGEMRDPGRLADMVACSLLNEPGQRQVILETADVTGRLQHLAGFLDAEVRRLRQHLK